MTEKKKINQEIRYELKDLKRVMLIGAFFSPHDKEKCKEFLDELSSLSDTYGFETISKHPCLLRHIEAGTYIGRGKLEELAEVAEKEEIDIVLFDDEITPNQQRNLEKMFNRPVIDRTELILEVFAQRAQTKEARIQIELAKTRYQLPRLKRLWTHLSRQSAGGKGFLKGEGERQIEIDRRLVRRRINRLQKELKEVKKHREIQRKSRLKSGIPTFAIVGYTNAGKSTLLNALTHAEVLVEDKLFATLDTTTRKFTLPNHQNVLLIDTVGFIRKIPHTIVAAFRSTLEEALFTDVLLHLVDITHPLALEHAEATYQVLKELGAKEKPIITVLNKIDQIEDPAIIQKYRVTFPKTVAISAKTREGFEVLIDMMMQELSVIRKIVRLRIPQSHYGIVSEIMQQGHILESEYIGNDILIIADIPSKFEHKLEPFLESDQSTHLA